MFDFLYQLISVSTGAITKTVKTAVSGGIAWMFSIWGLLSTALGAAIFVVKKLTSLIEYLLTKMTAAFDSYTAAIQDSYGYAGISTSILQLANTFFPLTETVTFAVTLLGIHAAFLAYRFVKSWIPTLS